MHCSVSSVLTMPVPVCEWLWCLAVSLPCWQYLSLALQTVSDCGALLCFYLADNAYPWLSSQWVAVVPCYVFRLLTMPILGSPESEWLVVPCCVSSLLKMPVLGSPVCEWLWFLSICLPCSHSFLWLPRWWVLKVPPAHLFTNNASQDVSHHAFMPIDNNCSYHFTKPTPHWPTRM